MKINSADLANYNLDKKKHKNILEYLERADAEDEKENFDIAKKHMKHAVSLAEQAKDVMALAHLLSRYTDYCLDEKMEEDDEYGFKRFVEVIESLFEDDHTEIALARASYGVFLMSLERLDESEVMCEAAAKCDLGNFAAASTVWDALSQVYRLQNKVRMAEEAEDKACEFRQRLLDRYTRETDGKSPFSSHFANSR